MVEEWEEEAISPGTAYSVPPYPSDPLPRAVVRLLLHWYFFTKRYEQRPTSGRRLRLSL